MTWSVLLELTMFCGWRLERWSRTTYVICKWQKGKTALMYAIESTRTDSVRVLLEHGAKMEAKNQVREFAFCSECRCFWHDFSIRSPGCPFESNLCVCHLHPRSRPHRMSHFKNILLRNWLSSIWIFVYLCLKLQFWCTDFLIIAQFAPFLQNMSVNLIMRADCVPERWSAAGTLNVPFAVQRNCPDSCRLSRLHRMCAFACRIRGWQRGSGWRMWFDMWHDPVCWKILVCCFAHAIFETECVRIDNCTIFIPIF